MLSNMKNRILPEMGQYTPAVPVELIVFSAGIEIPMPDRVAFGRTHPENTLDCMPRECGQLSLGIAIHGNSKYITATAMCAVKGGHIVRSELT